MEWIRQRWFLKLAFLLRLRKGWQRLLISDFGSFPDTVMAGFPKDPVLQVTVLKNEEEISVKELKYEARVNIPPSRDEVSSSLDVPL